MGRPVEAAELEPDADLPELGLDELRDPLVQLGRVVVVRDAGQPQPAREAGAREQLARERRIERQGTDALVEPRHRRRQDAARWRHAVLEEPPDGDAGIDGVGDREPDPAIVEGRPLDVEPDRARPERRPDRDVGTGPRIALDAAAVSRRNVGDVEVAGPVLVEARDLGGDDPEDDPVEERRAPEVLGEALEHELVVVPPLGEPERPGPDGVTGERGPAPGHLLARHDRGRVVRHQVEKGRERPLEGDLHAALAPGPDPGDLRGPAADEVPGPRDLFEHPGPLAPRGPLERVLHVGRPERATVLEPDPGAQVEGVDALVGRDRPALGEGAPHLEPLVELEEGVEDLPDDRRRGRVARLGGIERRRIGAERQAEGPAWLRGGGRGQDEERREEPGGQDRAGQTPDRGVRQGLALDAGWSTVKRSSWCRPVGCSRRPLTPGRTTAHRRRT